MREALKRGSWPLGIAGAALAIRLILFTGLQGTDDLFYSARALDLARGNLVPGSDLFATRLAYLAPIALLYRMFGIHIGGLVMVNLASSLLLVALAYRFGKELYSEKTGRGAALFVALLPLDVFHATEAHADLPMAALSGLALYLLWSGLSMPSGRSAVTRCALAGLALGQAHQVKESAFLCLLATLPWWRDRKAWPRLALAAGVFGAVVLGEIAFYAAVRGDALLRIHRVGHQLRGVPATEELGIGGRLLALAGFLVNPFDARFVYTGGLFWASLAGLGWALRRDRARSGWIVLWGAGLAALTAFWPASLVPFRPALNLFPRFFAGLALPGALLAARFFEEAASRARPRTAWAAAAALGILALGCSVRLHGDALQWRLGAEWARGALADRPGAEVITDSRTMEMVRFLGGYALPYGIRAYSAGDPPPPPGTLLLDNERWVRACEAWDGTRPPGWWRKGPPARETIAERTFDPPFRFRGASAAPERVRLSRVGPSP